MSAVGGGDVMRRGEARDIRFVQCDIEAKSGSEASRDLSCHTSSCPT